MVLYSIFKLRTDKHSLPFFLASSDINTAQHRFREIGSGHGTSEFTKVFPDSLKILMQNAVSSNPNMRPSLSDLKNNAWFNDRLVKGLFNLNEFYKLEAPKQKIYLNTFTRLLPEYSPRIILDRIIPFLKEQLLNPNNMQEVVGALLYILKKNCLKDEPLSKRTIWPIFQTLLTSKKISGQVLYLIISYIELVCSTIGKEEIGKSIINLFFKCYDCKVAEIQTLTLSKTDFLAKSIDFSDIKNKLLPRVILLCDDDDQRVKRAALKFIQSKLNVFDSSLAEGGLLKMIEKNLVSGNSASTNMILLSILKDISGNFSTDVIIMGDNFK